MDLHDRLCYAIAEKNWNDVTDVLKPKDFPRNERGTMIDKRILAKVAETVSAPPEDVFENVKIHLLKCLVNSCVDGYEHEEDNSENFKLQDYSRELYSSLSNADSKDRSASFPYNGIAAWAADYLGEFKDIEETEILPCHNILNMVAINHQDAIEVARLGVQFLCNLVTFGCKSNKLPYCINSLRFKSTIIALCKSNKIPLAKGACAYVHNALKQLPEDYFLKEQMSAIAMSMIIADKRGIQSARESLTFLLNRAEWLKEVYGSLHVEEQLYLLEFIHMDVRDSVYSGEDSEINAAFPTEVIEFISERFKKRSDLILKTVDSYLNGMEPAEITLLLDIIGVISSKNSVECHLLQKDKSLFINCIFLLKSLHMAGKASENHFTPIQKLSEIAPSTHQAGSSTDDIQNHPAFGFKAGLIRAIGNLSHKHKGNQEVLRETDAIPLLLDCCNIDARNPLIMQWTIFALKNLCDDCPENQEIIRNCNKVGVVDSVVLHEMGLKLHEGEDGKAIGILPLPRNG